MASKLIRLQVESYTKLISNKSSFKPYYAFMYRDQLREQCKDDPQATEYLEDVLSEAERSLHNILNFYPHK